MTRSGAIPATDAVVAGVGRRVRVLSALTWPVALEAKFLSEWRAGRPELPTPPAVSPPDITPLETLHFDSSDPLDGFVQRTSESYRRAAAMLVCAGTRAFTEHSIALYGSPATAVPGGGATLLEEAEHLLSTVAALEVPGEQPTLPSAEARRWLQDRVDPHFDGALPVEVHADLGSLAAAGASRIRLRGGVLWSEVQLEQLLQHEALVHAATKRNGRAQPLRTLGLSSPRTTMVQEGLATVAELITDTLDLGRLRRIALRVRMVHFALDGADFIEVFEQLLKSGLTASEAFRSAQRVFRGGDVRGGIAFTKDVVYLRGLREVHAFLLAALRARRPELARVLFAGRMSTGDALLLAPFVADGTLRAPEVVPPWLARMDRLAAYLAWAAFGQGIRPTGLPDFA